MMRESVDTVNKQNLVSNICLVNRNQNCFLIFKAKISLNSFCYSPLTFLPLVLSLLVLKW